VKDIRLSKFAISQIRSNKYQSGEIMQKIPKGRNKLARQGSGGEGQHTAGHALAGAKQALPRMNRPTLYRIE
jgi:hypothetical protein